MASIDELPLRPELRGRTAYGAPQVPATDRLNTNGQNAILKILEEPPARTVLLVVSENPGGLLPTIRSRCRVSPRPVS